MRRDEKRGGDDVSWMNASEYLDMEQAVRDRVDDAERFRTEQAFRSETPDDETPAPGAGSPAAGALGFAPTPWPLRDCCSTH
jgi:hypothetical protein